LPSLDIIVCVCLSITAPVAPGPVNITEVTNTSMVVTWQPPKSLNGALRYYDVLYSGRSKRLNVNTNVCKKKKTFKLV